MTATFLEEGPEQPDDSTSSVPPDHHHPDDVQSIKGQLDDVLGESSAKYWSLMEAFLTGMMIKCEFDHFVLQLLPADYGKLLVLPFDYLLRCSFSLAAQFFCLLSLPQHLHIVCWSG